MYCPFDSLEQFFECGAISQQFESSEIKIEFRFMLSNVEFDPKIEIMICAFYELICACFMSFLIKKIDLD